MILHWLKTGWRSLIANPLFSLITIASLSVGCCGALLAGATIRQHLEFDRWFPEAERTLLVRPHFVTATSPDAAASNIWFWGEKRAIEAVPGVEMQTRVGFDRMGMPSPENAQPADGVEPPLIRGLRIEPNFFDVFGLTFIEGSAVGRGVVLSESMARRLYGPPPWLGKRFRSGNATNTTVTFSSQVTGVVRDMPATSHLQVDVFSYHYAQVIAGNENNWRGDWVGGHYIRVKPDANMAAVQGAINAALEEAAAKANPNGTVEDEDGVPAGAKVTFTSLKLPDVHLAPFEESAMTAQGEMTLLVTLGGAALALLVVSAFNYVTLSLARSLRRRREVAMRKVLGAGGGSVMRHYLAESLLVTVISLALGFALAELLQPWFARALGQPDALVRLYDPLFLAAAAAAGLILALAVGAYPAIYLAHIRPRAGLEQNDAAPAGFFARFVSSGLLGLQIAAATVLLAFAMTMALQARYVSQRPLGYTTADTLAVGILCWPPPPPPNAPNQTQSFLPASVCDTPFIERLRTVPGVLRVSRAGADDLHADSSSAAAVVPAGQAGAVGDARHVAVDTDFLQMSGAVLLAGRLFDSNSAYDRQLLRDRTGFDRAQADRIPVVVTRAFLPMIGAAEPEEAIGKTFSMPSYARGVRSFEIVGVVEDWHRRSLRHRVDPIVFTPGGWTMQLILKIRPGSENDVRAGVRNLSGGRGNGLPLVNSITSFDDGFAAAMDEDRRLMAAVAGFAAFAMGVAGLGVFALTALEVRRRVREIGIRKALGATPARVAGMVLRKALVSAVIASVIGWPIAWWLSTAWLESYAYRTSLGLAVLPAATLIVVGFMTLAVLFNTLRAAAIRPSFALRTAA